MTARQAANTVLVDVRAKNPLLALTGHEFGHNLQAQRPELFGRLSDTIARMVEIICCQEFHS